MTIFAPLREQIANLNSSTLNGAHNNSTTTITVNAGANFPSAGNYRVRVGSEIMLVTARSTNDLTVVRGYEGTTAASHSSGDSITLVLTSGGLNRYAQDRNPYWGSARPPFGLFATDGVTPLTTADFTWNNQGTASITDQNGSIILNAPTATGENARVLYRSAPTPPYSVIAAFQACGIVESGCYQNFGFAWRQSTTGKFYGFGMAAHNGSDPYQINGSKMTNSTTYSGGDFFTKVKSQIRLSHLWLKIEDDNTNCKFYVGDGLSWILVKSDARANFLSLSGGVTGPDQVGFYVNNQGSSLYRQLLKLCHWSYL